MKTISAWLLLALVLVSAGCTSARYSPYLTKGGPPDPALYAAADLELGGQLYDDWYEIKTLVYVPGKGKKTKYPPTRSANPLFPREQQTNEVSAGWRCKSCHGWDYRGQRWPAGKGTTVPAPDLLKARHQAPVALFRSIAAGPPGHRFGEFLSEREIWALVRFVREGTVDMQALLTKGGKIRGDAVKGAVVYRDKCANCHGVDGDRIDLRARKPGSQGLGWRSNGNPRLTWHRVSWGMWYDWSGRARTRVTMPSARVDLGLSEQQVRDVLAYAQTLGKPGR